MFFSLECGNFWQAGKGNTAAALKLQKAAGGFGIVASVVSAISIDGGQQQALTVATLVT